MCRAWTYSSFNPPVPGQRHADGAADRHDRCGATLLRDRITAVIPTTATAGRIARWLPRAPITAKLVADLITRAGANRVLAMDLHAGQIQGFFNIPVDNLFATPVLLEYIKKHHQGDNVVIVSPDTGGVERARAFGKRLGASLAIIDKRREGPNEAQVMNIVGQVKGMKVILLTT